MALRIRKTERQTLTDLLDSEWDSVDDLAAAVFRTCTEAVLARDWWVTLVGTREQVMVFGPWSSASRAVVDVPMLEVRNPEAKITVRKLAVVGRLDDEDA